MGEATRDRTGTPPEIGWDRTLSVFTNLGNIPREKSRSVNLRRGTANELPLGGNCCRSFNQDLRQLLRPMRGLHLGHDDFWDARLEKM